MVSISIDEILCNIVLTLSSLATDSRYITITFVLDNEPTINSFEIRLGVGSRFLTKLILTSIDSTKASFGPMTPYNLRLL